MTPGPTDPGRQPYAYEPAPVTPGTILVVDDEPEIRSLLSDRFTRRGYQVLEAGDAEEGLRRVLRDRPDVVLLDLVLPGMNGVETLRRIRRYRPGVGIIVITGAANRELAESTLQVGAVDFVLKPFNFARLDRAVERSLAYFAGGGPGDRLEVEIVRHGEVMLVALAGSLDAAAVDQIKRTLADLIDKGATRLLIDLGNVHSVDSSGLGTLVAAMKRARAAGGDLRLCAPSPVVREILEMTGLVARIGIHDDVAAGLASFSSEGG